MELQLDKIYKVSKEVGLKKEEKQNTSQTLNTTKQYK